MTERDQGTDPYFIAEPRESVEQRAQDLAEYAEGLRELLNLVKNPEWNKFEQVLDARLHECERALVRAGDWEEACRLQGQARGYEWVLGLSAAYEASLRATMEELQELQEQMEEE